MVPTIAAARVFVRYESAMFADLLPVIEEESLGQLNQQVFYCRVSRIPIKPLSIKCLSPEPVVTYNKL